VYQGPPVPPGLTETEPTTPTVPLLAERQITLPAFEHPAIARLYEAAPHRRRATLPVMDWIDDALAEYCETGPPS